RAPGGAERVGRDALRHEAERKRLFGADAAAAHDHVLRPSEPDQPREALRAAAARDHAEPHLGERELGAVRGEAEVARERELEADAEHVAVERRDDGLRAALGRGHVPGEPRQLRRRPLEEHADVAAGRERLAGAAEHDCAHPVVAAELVEYPRELLACVHRDAVELPGHVERDGRDPLGDLDAEPVVGHVAIFSVRSRRRRILPDGLFGSWPTKRESRGRFQRGGASLATQNASRSSAVVPGPTTTTATTRCPSRSSRSPTTATSITFGCRATTSSTSSGCTFSPPEMIMSSTRPTSQRSP